MDKSQGAQRGCAMGWADGKATGHKHRHGGIIVAVAGWHHRARVPVTVGVLPMPLRHHGGAVVIIVVVVVCQCRHSVSSCQAQVVFFWQRGGHNRGCTKGARRGGRRGRSLGTAVATLSCQAQGAVVVLWCCHHHHCGGGGGLPMPLRRRHCHHRGSGGGGIVGVLPA